MLESQVTCYYHLSPNRNVPRTQSQPDPELQLDESCSHLSNYYVHGGFAVTTCVLLTSYNKPNRTCDSIMLSHQRPMMTLDQSLSTAVRCMGVKIFSTHEIKTLTAARTHCWTGLLCVILSGNPLPAECKIKPCECILHAHPSSILAQVPSDF